MEYLRRYRDLKYQETVFELLAKEYEVAKLDEAREGSIVQVVDAAVPPDTKSSPHRTLIVLGATIVAFFVAVFWVCCGELWPMPSSCRKTGSGCEPSRRCGRRNGKRFRVSALGPDFALSSSGCDTESLW